MATAFEMHVRNLHLTPDQYVGSDRLRRWCEENKNQYYVPEWLLKAWNISVNSDLTGTA
jgi:hypothetical protein